jgi:hypothetical protein
MCLKSAIITLASIAEAALTVKVRRGFGGDTNFKVRLNNAQQIGLIDVNDRQELSKLWDKRCKVHFKRLEGSEFGKYEDADVELPRAALDRMLGALKKWHEGDGAR